VIVTARANPGAACIRTSRRWRAGPVSGQMGVVMPPKTSCPVSLTQFVEKAEPMKVIINGQEMLAEVKTFSTGSFGWYMNGKTVVSIDGKAVSVQIGMNLTIVGSKDAER
jgi:hypothetical protein